MRISAWLVVCSTAALAACGSNSRLGLYDAGNRAGSGGSPGNGGAVGGSGGSPGNDGAVGGSGTTGSGGAVGGSGTAGSGGTAGAGGSGSGTRLDAGAIADAPVAKDAPAVDARRSCGGFAGFPCAPGEFCEMAPASCKIADALGTCVTRPRICPAIYAPVCGCDGKTYASDCARQVAGVSKQSDGACPGDAGADATACANNGGCAALACCYQNRCIPNGQPCGPGEVCFFSLPSNGSCQACGHAGQPCCANNQCVDGSRCLATPQGARCST